MPIEETLSIDVYKSHTSVRLGVIFSGKESVPRLVAIKPGGAAASSGLQINDILLEMDGEQLTTPLETARMLRERCGTITLTVLRSIFTHEDHAATVIAARWRGFDLRAVKKSWQWAATEIQCSWRGAVTRWEIMDCLHYYTAIRMQAAWRGRIVRKRTSSLLDAAKAERKPLDKKAVNQVQRALSFNRKPRKRGKDGGEFSALLEGSPEDIEARLLARRQQTARTIEKAMGGVRELAPQAPTDAEMADPLVMQAYMFALGEHAYRQQAAIQEHEAAVRENRWGVAARP